MSSAKKPLTYEKERLHIIEENKRRMMELGLMETVESFQKLRLPRKTQFRKVSNNVELGMETRRSSRSASRPKIDYKEPLSRKRILLASQMVTCKASSDVGKRPRHIKGFGRPLLRRGYISSAAKTEAAVRAGEIKTSHPSFVKAMLKSHTSGGFWLGLPSEFCSMNFSKDDVIVLEDEEGLEWECIYLHHKHGLSGGWRGFSLDHDLEDGDAVLFELVTSSRFKVYITRSAGNEEASSQKTAAVPKKRDYRYVVKDSKDLQGKFLKPEKEETYRKKRDGYKQTNSTQIGRRNVRRNYYDCTSDDSQKSEDVLEGTSQDQSTDEESVQSSDDDIQPATIWKEKNSKVTKRPGKSKQQLKGKIELKSRQITSGGKESSKVSSKIVKKDASVRRADRKTDTQEIRRANAARQVEQKCGLPPGTRLKPVGVCSIARGSTKRKLPALFCSRKYNFFSGPKSIKVH